MKGKYITSLVWRYFALLLLAMFVSLFYFVFTPLTVLPVFGVLKIFFGASLLPNNIIVFSGIRAAIIPACVAGAAYLLLMILNLSSPMALKTRIKSIIFLLFTFLILNVLRIMAFALLAVNGFSHFDIAHEMTWYFGSTFLVALIWFSNVKVFNIRSIPFYTDFNILWRAIKYGRD